MNAIVVADRNWAIGRNNGLLFSLPGDMKHFRTLTSGGTVIMGRRTLDSFPGGRPLPKRRNIVITRDPDFCREGCEIVHHPEEALALAGDGDDVWLIGGGSIYRGSCRRRRRRSGEYLCQQLIYYQVYHQITLLTRLLIILRQGSRKAPAALMSCIRQRLT